MSIGDIKNKAKQTTPKQFFGVLGIAFLLWIVGSMLFGCDNSCKKKSKTCKKGRIEQSFDATKRAGEGAVGIVKGAGESAAGIVKGAGNAVEKAAQSTRQSVFGRTAQTEIEAVETTEAELEDNTEAPVKAAATTEKTIVATSNPNAVSAVRATPPAATTATTESKTVVTEEIIKKKIIVEVEFQTPDGKVLGSKDVAIDETAAVETAAAKEALVVEPKAEEVVATPAKADSPIDAKIEQLQKEIEKLNAAKALLEDLK